MASTRHASAPIGLYRSATPRLQEPPWGDWTNWKTSINFEEELALLRAHQEKLIEAQDGGTTSEDNFQLGTVTDDFSGTDDDDRYDRSIYPPRVRNMVEAVIEEDEDENDLPMVDRSAHLWAQSLLRLKRALEEIECLCEFENNDTSVKEVEELLKRAADKFNSLRRVESPAAMRASIMPFFQPKYVRSERLLIDPLCVERDLTNSYCHCGLMIGPMTSPLDGLHTMLDKEVWPPTSRRDTPASTNGAPGFSAQVTPISTPVTTSGMLQQTSTESTSSTRPSTGTIGRPAHPVFSRSPKLSSSTCKPKISTDFSEDMIYKNPTTATPRSAKASTLDMKIRRMDEETIAKGKKFNPATLGPPPGLGFDVPPKGKGKKKGDDEPSGKNRKKDDGDHNTKGKKKDDDTVGKGKHRKKDEETIIKDDDEPSGKGKKKDEEDRGKDKEDDETLGKGKKNTEEDKLKEKDDEGKEDDEPSSKNKDSDDKKKEDSDVVGKDKKKEDSEGKEDEIIGKDKKKEDSDVGGKGKKKEEEIPVKSKASSLRKSAEIKEDKRIISGRCATPAVSSTAPAYPEKKRTASNTVADDVTPAAAKASTIDEKEKEKDKVETKEDAKVSINFDLNEMFESMVNSRMIKPAAKDRLESTLGHPRRGEELRHQVEERHRRAEQRREAHGERKTNHVKIIESRQHEARQRRAEKENQKQNLLLEKMSKARRIYQEQLRAICQRARKENRKTAEVVYIQRENSVGDREDERETLERKHEKALVSRSRKHEQLKHRLLESSNRIAAAADRRKLQEEAWQTKVSQDIRDKEQQAESRRRETMRAIKKRNIAMETKKESLLWKRRLIAEEDCNQANTFVKNRAKIISRLGCDIDDLPEGIKNEVTNMVLKSSPRTLEKRTELGSPKPIPKDLERKISASQSEKIGGTSPNTNSVNPLLNNKNEKELQEKKNVESGKGELLFTKSLTSKISTTVGGSSGTSSATTSITLGNVAVEKNATEKEKEKEIQKINSTTEKEKEVQKDVISVPSSPPKKGKCNDRTKEEIKNVKNKRPSRPRSESPSWAPEKNDQEAVHADEGDVSDNEPKTKRKLELRRRTEVRKSRMGRITKPLDFQPPSRKKIIKLSEEQIEQISVIGGKLEESKLNDIDAVKFCEDVSNLDGRNKEEQPVLYRARISKLVNELKQSHETLKVGQDVQAVRELCKVLERSRREGDHMLAISLGACSIIVDIMIKSDLYLKMSPVFMDCLKFLGLLVKHSMCRLFLILTNKLQYVTDVTVSLLQMDLTEDDESFASATFCLSQLFHVLGFIIKQSIPQEYTTIKQNQCEYMLLCGLAETMTLRFQYAGSRGMRLFDTSPLPLFLLRSTEFLSNILQVYRPNIGPLEVEGSIGSKENPERIVTGEHNALISAILQTTEIFGLVSLLSNFILADWKITREMGAPTDRRLSQTALTLCLFVSRVLVSVARLDVKILQNTFGGNRMHELTHLIVCVVDYCANRPEVKGDGKECEVLHEIIHIIGFYILLSDNQEMLQMTQGNSERNLLSRLASLPLMYFLEEKLKDILFPTLLCAVFRSPSNMEILRNEMNLLTLKKYIQNFIDNPTNDLSQSSLSYRFPISLLPEALELVKSNC